VAVATIDKAVEGFLPSTKGFHFPNHWPEVPVTRIQVMRGLEVPIGDASKGLCGGMVYAVRDLVRVGAPVPADRTAPATGPLYEYIGRRLIDSFDLPSGPMKYYAWMAMPDADTSLLGLAVVNRGVGTRTVDEEWPQIRGDLDRGHVSCLGLVCAKSYDPFDLGENHQVLAWRYRVRGDEVTIWVYDPNQPGNDDAHLRFHTSDPASGIEVRFSGSSKQVRGIFRAPYRPVRPPTF
jgi:hypothetical protein